MTPSTPSASGAGRHALVVGGSMAGLLAGRVLADHFERVTIVERDRFPANAPGPRRGVPQAQHLHILLMRGQAIVEQLFPGLRDELVADGAPLVDSAEDFLWRNPAGWALRYRSGLTKLAFTRDLLDWHVRRRLAAFGHVRFMEGTDVTGLLPGPDGGVRGVQARSGADHALLEADLVVDASGRGSRAPGWLAALGYPVPEESLVDAHLGYASRLYRPPAGFRGDWRALFLQAAPPGQPRAGVVFSVEGGRWIVSLAGGAGDRPPTDEAGFLEFARSLPSPALYEAIRNAEPLTPIAGTRSGENRLRHYERLTRWPERFVVMGDAVCAFNPVYGQGMTVAALEALALDRSLREQPRRPWAGMARGFQRRLAGITALPWTLATSEDSRYLGTQGARLDGRTWLMHRYMDQVLALTTRNRAARRTLLEVQHMLRPPTALFRPAMLAPVLGRLVAPRERSQPVGGDRGTAATEPSGLV